MGNIVNNSIFGDRLKSTLDGERLVMYTIVEAPETNVILISPIFQFKKVNKRRTLLQSEREKKILVQMFNMQTYLSH